MNKWWSLIATLAVVLVAISGYFGFTQYEQHKFVESIRPHVKNSSLRVMNATRYETDDGSRITFKELFEKLESDIAEIDKRILEVQTIATPGNKEITEPVLEYLRGSQELLRSLLTKYRKRLAVSNASEWTNRAINELRTAGAYGAEHAIKASDKALKDYQKAIDEYTESTIDVLGATKNLKSAYVKVAAILPSDVLVDLVIIDAIVRKNEPKPRDTATDAKK